MLISEHLQAGAVRGPSQSRPDQFVEDLAELEFTLDGVRDPASLTVMEREAIWRAALQSLDALVNAGKPSKLATAAVLDMLTARVPKLSANRHALAEMLRAKRARWAEQGGAPDALVDQRVIANQARRKKYNPDDRDKILWESATRWNGKRAPAIRALVSRGDLTPEVLVEEKSRTGRKSDVRESMLRATALAPTLAIIHQGQRAADKLVPSLDRDYGSMYAMQQWQADDFTMPVYFYVPNGRGWWKPTRGQVILVVDVRSWRVMRFALQPDEQPNSLAVREAFVGGFEEFGIPDQLYLERGRVFQGSKLITGGHKSSNFKQPFSDAEVHEGLRRHGVQIIHARRARSKIIERIGGLLQDRMHGERGFCGRRPDHSDVPDALRGQLESVKKRREHPSQFFYSQDEWRTRLHQICDDYNEERQEGRILGGLSPEEAFQKHQPPPDRRPIRLDGRLWQLLATHPVSNLVVSTGKYGGGGVEFSAPIFGRVRYFSEELGGWVGHKVTAWHTVGCPDWCTFSPDEDMSQTVTVARHIPVNAAETDEHYQQQASAAQGFLRPARTLYGTLKAKFRQEFRQNLPPDAPTAAIVGELERVQHERAERPGKDRRLLDGRRRLRNAGILLPL